MFGENEVKHSDDFKKCTIKSFKNFKYLKKFRSLLKKKFGKKAAKLQAEGNNYFELKSGIGFHGDAERKVIICLNLGRSMQLRY